MKSFKFYISLIIVLGFLSSCSDSGCIDSDDFGDFKTDIVDVYSSNSVCEWTYEEDPVCEYAESGSVLFGLCNPMSGGTIISGTTTGVDGICTVTYTGSFTNGYIGTFNTCVRDCSVNTELLGKFSFSSGCGNLNSQDEAKIALIKEVFLKKAEEFLEACKEEAGFEPMWVKDDNIINISPDQYIRIRANGNVNLFSNSSKIYRFGVDKKYIQETDSNARLFFLDSAKSFYVDGRWCRNGNVGSCEASKQVGEFDPIAPNVILRNEFLRRGVVIVRTLPNDGSIDNNGNYSGTAIHPNFNDWRCNINDSGDFNCGSTRQSIYEQELIAGYQSFYEIDNKFVKNIGGLVIPENIRKYITNNPFDSCYNNSGALECNELSEKYEIQVSGSVVDDLHNGYFMPNNDQVLRVDVTYPVKIAFKFIGDDGYDDVASDLGGTQTNANSCVLSVNVDGSTTYYTIAVNPSRNWQFLTVNNENSIVSSYNDGTSSHTDLYNGARFNSFNSAGDFQKYDNAVILGADKYGVVWKDQNTDYQAFNRTYSINFAYLGSDTGNSNWNTLTWTEKKGEGASTERLCSGAKIAVFLLPQNDILVNASGFVNFKRLPVFNSLGVELSETCSVEGINTNKQSCASNAGLEFDIINPMYKITENRDSNDMLGKNFYEYIVGSNPGISRKQSVAVSIGNDWTASDIFVRKGQILRFSDKGWYDITDTTGGNNGSIGYTIKTIKGHRTNDDIMKNLVMRITERPALLCKGFYSENISNDNCIPDGDGGCSVSFGTMCAENPASANYCPMGCYKDMGGTVCVDSPQGVACNCSYGVLLGSPNLIAIENASSVKCTSCQTLINETRANISPTVPANLIQCHDLENYIGATRNITENYDGDSNPLTCYSIGGVTNDKNLTACDTYLGAKILGSILSSSSYGNLSGLALDSANVVINDSGSKSYNYAYNSAGKNFIITRPSVLEFLVVDNECFDSTCWHNNYLGNTGSYNFYFSGSSIFSNGANLAVILANKDLKINNPNEIVNIYYPEDTGINLNDSNNAVWISSYETGNNEHFGEATANSPYYFNSNGHLLRAGDNASNLYLSQLRLPANTNYDNLRLFFKIVDKHEGGCGGNFKMVCDGIIDINGTCCDSGLNSDNLCVSSSNPPCRNAYFNNLGTYTVTLKTPISSFSGDATGALIKNIIQPVIELMDGKFIGLLQDASGNLYSCDSADSSACYACANASNAALCTENELKNMDTFGERCSNTDTNYQGMCYKNCNNSLDGFRCTYMNDNNGFLARFYKAVIIDSNYQTILRLCFVLMVTFYGMYYLMGLAEFNQSEFIRRLVKIGFIYLMVGNNGWYYYNRFFVKFFKGGVDYLAFSIAGAFNYSDAEIVQAFTNGDFHDKSVLFNGADRVISLILSEQVTKKIWGLFFVSFFGWIYVFLMYSALLTYICAVGNALLVYMVAQFFISLLLSFGPIMFVLLVFEKTKGMFDKWINALVGFSLEQIFLLTCLSLFNTIAYSVIKSVLSFRVCWRPIWTIPFFNVNLMSFWKATSSTSPAGAASAIPGLFQILLVWLVADLMKQFIGLVSELSKDFSGSALSASKMGEGIAGKFSSFYNTASKEFKGAMKSTVTRFAKNTIGYKTSEEEQQQEKNLKTILGGRKQAKRAGDKEVANYVKDHGIELNKMTSADRNKKLAEIESNAIKKSISSNEDYKKAFKAEFGAMSDDKMLEKTTKMNAAELHTSSSIIGFAGNLVRRGLDRNDTIDKRNKKIESGKAEKFNKKALDSAIKTEEEKRLAGASKNLSPIARLNPFNASKSSVKADMKEVKKEAEGLYKASAGERKEYKRHMHDIDASLNRHHRKGFVGTVSAPFKNVAAFVTPGKDAYVHDEGIRREFEETLQNREKNFVPSSESKFSTADGNRSALNPKTLWKKMVKPKAWKDDYKRFRELPNEVADEMKEKFKTEHKQKHEKTVQEIRGESGSSPAIEEESSAPSDT